MNLSHFSTLGGLSRRIYAAFLLAAVIPPRWAGTIGVYLSLQTLNHETQLQPASAKRAYFWHCGEWEVYLRRSNSLSSQFTISICQT